MEAIRQLFRKPKDREIRITVPDSFAENEIFEVILVSKNNSQDYSQKIQEMQSSMSDPLFIAAMLDIQKDFKNSDRENWI